MKLKLPSSLVLLTTLLATTQGVSGFLNNDFLHPLFVRANPLDGIDLQPSNDPNKNGWGQGPGPGMPYLQTNGQQPTGRVTQVNRVVGICIVAQYTNAL